MHSKLDVKKWHNLSLSKSQKDKYLQPFKKELKPGKNKEVTKKETPVKDVKEDETIEQKPVNIKCPIDSDGYINIDLENSKGLKGIRLLFQREEGRTRRKVALQIDK